MSKNKEKLNESFGDISSNFIESTVKPPSRKKTVWVRLVAAVVCVAVMISAIIAVGIIMNRKNKPIIREPSWTDGGRSEDYDPESYLKYVLLDAEYPEMAKYQGDGKYGTPEYEAWRKDFEMRLEYSGAGEDLDEFFAATITEFLSGHGENNAVYSPLNVYFALAMLAEITDGNSRQQILDLLDAENIEALRTQAHSIWNANYIDEGTVKSILASSLWLDEEYSFHEDKLNILKEYYYSSVFSGDLGTDETNFAFRSWLNEQTGGLADRLSDIELDPNTVLALVTTMQFAARWTDGFSVDKTEAGVFHSPNGDMECDFMNSDGTKEYYWGDKFSAVEMYLTNSGKMFFILPDEDVSIDELLSDEEALRFITNEKNEWKKSKTTWVEFSVPKFDVQSDMNLKNGLQNLGVSDCFNEAVSDYTSITDHTGIYVDKIQHGAGVKIDEEGVVASALTDVRLMLSPAPSGKVNFTLDRPFIFVITGNDGTPLFVGVVNQP